MVRAINVGGGFKIVGWFKPATYEGTAVEHKKFQIARLEPEKELTDAERAKMYGAATTTSTTASGADNQ